MDFSALLPQLRACAVSEGEQVYLVGGCVRDGLMGRPLRDVDIAVTGSATAFAQTLAVQLGATYVPLGQRFGASRVVLRNADQGVREIDCSPLHGDVLQDLAARDFTIDALAVPLSSFTGAWDTPALIDPHHGLADLHRGLIRMVSPESFTADPLRLLRAVRLQAELGFTIDEPTAATIHSNSEGLATCAPERIRDEMYRLLEAPGTVGSVETLDSLGLLGVVFPALMDGKDVAQPKEHYWDVFRHQVETMAAAEAVCDHAVHPKLGERPHLQLAVTAPHWPQLEDGYFAQRCGAMSHQAIMKLAALLHDVAKPATKTVDATGRTRFFGHAELGAEMATDALAAIRFSNKEVQAVATLVRYHLRPTQLAASGQVPTGRAIFRFFRDLDGLAIDTLMLSMADHLGARGPLLHLPAWNNHVAYTDYVIGQHYPQAERRSAERLLTGRDLMAALGLQPGPLVGQLLAAVDEATATGAARTREQALAVAARHLQRKRPAVVA